MAITLLEAADPDSARKIAKADEPEKGDAEKVDDAAADVETAEGAE